MLETDSFWREYEGIEKAAGEHLADRVLPEFREKTGRWRVRRVVLYSVGFSVNPSLYCTFIHHIHHAIPSHTPYRSIHNHKYYIPLPLYTYTRTGHAKAIFKERERLTSILAFDRLAVPPTGQGQGVFERQQLEMWNNWIR